MLWLIGQETVSLQERVILGLTEIRTSDPSHYYSSGGDSVYHLSAIPGVSFRSNYFTPSAPVLCWCGKCQHQVRETQTVPEYPLQLGCQTLALQDPPRILSHVSWDLDFPIWFVGVYIRSRYYHFLLPIYINWDPLKGTSPKSHSSLLEEDCCGNPF